MDRRQFMVGGASWATAMAAAGKVLRAEDGLLELRAMRARAPLLGADEPQTEIWCYNGVVPGPIVRARRGDRVRIRLVNELDEPTTIHWHGIRIENAMDGVAGLTQDPVMPGGTFDYEFTVPDAGTYWYHSHNKSWEQLARGLFGQLIVDGDAGDFATDHVLMIDDWRLGDDGVIHEQSFGSMMDWSHAGRLGNWVTVNGVSDPVFDLTGGGANRLRLVNASNARVYELLLDNLDVRLIALDGQAFDNPRMVSAPLVLGPAQRADLVAFGKQGSRAELLALNGDERVALASFGLAGSEAPSSTDATAMPELRTNDIPEPDLNDALAIDLLMEGGAMGMMRGALMGHNHDGMDAMAGMADRGFADMRELVQNGFAWALDGTAGMPEKPLFAVPAGRTVRINFANETRWPHAMHLHGHHFRVLSRNGREEPGKPWRDTVMTDQSERVEVAFVADNPGKWMLHCHMAEHMAAGMMTWFEVSG